MQYWIGMDIGGTSIKVGLVDAAGHILIKDSIKTEPDRLNQTEIMSAAADLVERVLEAAKVPVSAVSALGIGAPGTVDQQSGLLIFAGNLNFDHLPARALLKARLNLPVYLTNDANAAALAEARIGAGVGSRSSILVTLGTGLGGGIILNDRVFSGFNGAGSELGHMVIQMGGEPCTCGRRGCFEVYASATALIRQTRRQAERLPASKLALNIARAQGKVNGRTAFLAAAEGCPAAEAVVAQYLEYLAEGLANLINVVMPEIIILGGGISHEGEDLLQQVRSLALERAFLFGSVARPRFALATLGNDAGISGAAMFAMDCQRDGLSG